LSVARADVRGVPHTPEPLAAGLALQPEKNADAFFRKFWLRLRKGVDGKLFFAGKKQPPPIDGGRV